MKAQTKAIILGALLGGTISASIFASTLSCYIDRSGQKMLLDCSATKQAEREKRIAELEKKIADLKCADIPSVPGPTDPYADRRSECRSLYAQLSSEKNRHQTCVDNKPCPASTTTVTADY